MGITTSSNDDVRGEREGGLDFTLDLPQAILLYNVYINKTIELLECLKL